MSNTKVTGKRGASARKQNPQVQGGFGQATAAEKNRELAARRGIVQALSRLGIPYAQWPDAIQAFYTDPGQSQQYHQYIAPSPFRPPKFDRLNQSPKDWAKAA